MVPSTGARETPFGVLQCTMCRGHLLRNGVVIQWSDLPKPPAEFYLLDQEGYGPPRVSAGQQDVRLVAEVLPEVILVAQLPAEPLLLPEESQGALRVAAVS